MRVIGLFTRLITAWFSCLFFEQKIFERQFFPKFYNGQIFCSFVYIYNQFLAFECTESEPLSVSTYYQNDIIIITISIYIYSTFA